MNSFLSIVAEDLYGKLGGDLQQLTIVFPNKRARLFFNQHLADMAGRPVWTPRYMTISELFQSLSPLTVADPILLICHLYRVYAEVTGSQEPLDHFYSWGETLLADFDDIDNNMAPVDSLFHNIEDLNALTDLSHLTAAQIAAIQQFFQNFNPQNSTQLKQKFLGFWNALLPIYHRFRTALAEAGGLAYEGMMKRTVIEHLGEAPEGQFAFVGFNVLNKTEQELFKFLKNNRPTFFYWDFDQAYLKESHEAGRFIRENIRTFGNALPLDADCYNQFAQPKRISYIASPTDNAQTHLIETWAGHSNARDTEQAIVLCNESILQSVLHSIPSGKKVNVTMGFPMQQTPIASWIDTVLNLQLHGQAGSGEVWRYSFVGPVLQHPCTARLAGDEASSLLNMLRNHHTMFPTTQQLQQGEHLTTLFTRQDSNIGLLRYLATLVQQIGITYRDADEPLAIETAYNAYTMLNRLQRIYETGLLNVSMETLARLIRQMMADKSIPFHGEPAEGLQVMGVLETRNLDFRNLLMLSVNEGHLPKSDHRTSFIPYSLRDTYGMTTIEKQNSLYAYYFYRLLGRAEDITLVYNNSTEGQTRGEMSRFMMQLLVDHPQLAIRKLALSAENGLTDEPKFQIEKSTTVMERLRQRYDVNCNGEKARILSPSALNTYMSCGMKFYFQYVAGLKTQEEITEEVGNDVFGTIFHYCMEHIYGGDVFPLGQELQAQQLYQLSKQPDTLRRLVDEAFNMEFFKVGTDRKHQRPHYNGTQLLNREVIVTYLSNQLRHDALHCPMTVTSVEDDSHSMFITLESGIRLKLGGIVDRIDLVTTQGSRRQKRIVDYKTSSQSQKANSIAELFIPHPRQPNYHYMQALYYCNIMAQTDPEPLQPVINYIKNGDEKDLDITNYQQQAQSEYHTLLTQLIGDIFDPALPFLQDESRYACQYCDFAQLCHRELG